MRTQKWIVFDHDAKESQIEWWLRRHKDACGYITGIPRSLAERAEVEGWTLPHIYEEVVNDSAT
jgi:hypothetical protein